MSTEKFSARLTEEIESRRARGLEAGLTARVIAEERLPVSVMHSDRLKVVANAKREVMLKDLEAQCARCMKNISATLKRLGRSAQLSPLSNSIVAELAIAEMAQVAQLGEVVLLSLESLDPVTCMNESARVIEAPDVWNLLNITGKNVKVAILDSGVDKNHPALAGRVIAAANMTSEPITTPGQHGTHVAGTVASQDSVYRGVAPGAELINVKVLTSGGSAQPQWVVNGIAQAVSLGAQVINMSLGWSLIHHNWTRNDADCILCRAADTAVDMGVVVVVVAGNENTMNKNPVFAGKSNIRCPGNARKVITVGAVDKSKNLGSGFGVMSGTSMAAPHVAGLAALALERYPRAKPKIVKNLLEHTCEPLPYDNDQTGDGLINAYTAAAHLNSRKSKRQKS